MKLSKTKREIDRILREAGMSKKELKKANEEFLRQRAKDIEPLIKAQDEDLARLGERMKPLLSDNNLPMLLKGLPKVNRKVITACREDADVKAAMPEIEKVLPWGIRPQEIWYTFAGISFFLRRLIEDEFVSSAMGIRLVRDRGAYAIASNKWIEFDRLIEETVRMNEISWAIAEALTVWAVDTSSRHPDLFPDFETTPHAEGGVFLSLKKPEEVP